jgi:translocation and assembly module TamB
LGEATGQLDADATTSPDGQTLDATVQVRRFELDLPSTGSRSVQTLDPAQDIAIGMYQPNGSFVALSLERPRKPRPQESTRYHVVVDLDGVRLRRGTTLDVTLDGKPVVDIAGATQVNGTVHLKRGHVEVFGKRFNIEPGSTASFTGDPDNPQLVATASYDTHQNTKLLAELRGPVKKPKIQLRSEPAGLSEDQMLGLLVVGSADGLGGTPPPSQQSFPTLRAAGYAGGVVTQELNTALTGITSLDVSTRLDTSNAANPRPEVEVRVSNTVTTRVTVNTGMPAPGETPDRTLLSVDWQFKPRWSLETTVGDQGSSRLDVLWRHRY